MAAIGANRDAVWKKWRQVIHRGRLAFQQTAAYGNVATADQLLKAGADPSLKNNRGQTAVDIARTEHTTSVLERLSSASR